MVNGSTDRPYCTGSLTTQEHQHGTGNPTTPTSHQADLRSPTHVYEGSKKPQPTHHRLQGFPDLVPPTPRGQTLKGRFHISTLTAQPDRNTERQGRTCKSISLTLGNGRRHRLGIGYLHLEAPEPAFLVRVCLFEIVLCIHVSSFIWVWKKGWTPRPTNTRVTNTQTI